MALQQQLSSGTSSSAPALKSRGLGIMNNVGFAGAGLLAVLSIWPGYALGCFALFLVIAAGVLGLGWLVAIAEFVSAEKAGKVMAKSQLLSLPTTACITLLILKLHLVQLVVFAMAHSRFNTMIAGAPVVDIDHSARRSTPVDRWLGPYHVIEYAADARGGVYFVTGNQADGLGPDTTSYGFVYKPNLQGSPFGRKYYDPVHLFGDWYMFEASDDF